MNSIQFFGALELGLLYGLVALGVYLTFRVINFPDLTVDGSYPLGAAVVSILIVHQVHPLLATLVAVLAGGVAGFVTGYLHVRWKILGLLAGILTMTALYSINLRIMGKPNIALMTEHTLFTEPDHVLPILIGTVLCLLLLLAGFLSSQFGLALRATGINPRVSPAYGINTGIMTITGLAISNGLVALAGALVAQVHGFADISMGTGTLIVGLASVIIGETLFLSRNLLIVIFSTVLGAILYRLAIALALNTHGLGLQTSDINLITSVLVVVALLSPKLKQRVLAQYRRQGS
jgi:putative tryptophan/tyrosine transport system permease protein